MQWEKGTNRVVEEEGARSKSVKRKMQSLLVTSFEELAGQTVIVEEDDARVEYEVNLFRFPNRTNYTRLSPEVCREEVEGAIHSIDPKNRWKAGNSEHLAALIDTFEQKGFSLGNYIVALGNLCPFDMVPTSHLNVEKVTVIVLGLGKKFFANTTSFLVVRKKV